MDQHTPRDVADEFAHQLGIEPERVAVEQTPDDAILLGVDHGTPRNPHGELPKREPNPYLDTFDGPGALNPELAERAEVAMAKAVRLETEEGGAAFRMVVAGPAAAYYMGLAMHAALLFEDFRADPQAVMAAERMGSVIAEGLLSYPGHEASIRPLGQMLAAAFEAYQRLGWRELLRRFDRGRELVGLGSMPGAAFDLMARGAEMLARYQWHPASAEGEQVQAGPDPLSPEERPNPWFEATPVADSVLVDLSATQVIPEEARGPAEGLTRDGEAFPGLEKAYADFVERKGVKFQCSRCFLWVPCFRGEEAQAMELHQGTDECKRWGLA